MRVTAGRAACLGERMARCTFPPFIVEGTSEDPMAVESDECNQDFSSLRRSFMVMLAHRGRRQIIETSRVSVDLCCCKKKKKNDSILFIHVFNVDLKTFEL